MADTAEEIVEEGKSVLDMSDEEFNNLPDPVSEETDNIEETDSVVAEQSESAQEETGAETDTPDKEVNEDVSDETPDTKLADAVPQEDTPAAIDFEAEYHRLTAPFRANGKELQVTNVDDAITLMQMGANYNKKMAGLKPNMKLLKMLEKNDLLDPEKINRLIDLEKKDPNAIKQLLKDSDINIDEIDPDEDVNYKPTTYNVNEAEIDLDGVISDIRESDTFDETIDAVSNKWDQKSKKTLLDHPRLLSVIDDHMARGIYPTVMGIVKQEQMLGRLTEMSDIEAYQHVGNAIQAQGGFNPVPAEQPQATEMVPGKQKASDPALNDKKRAASTTRSTPAKAPEYNPLSMSDEDFEKAIGSKLF